MFMEFQEHFTFCENSTFCTTYLVGLRVAGTCEERTQYLFKQLSLVNEPRNSNSLNQYSSIDIHAIDTWTQTCS